MKPVSTIFLASASPRRQKLLRQIGIEPHIITVMVDESVNAAEDVASYVARLALAKAMAGWQWLTENSQQADTSFAQSLVLGADTSIALGSHILGKPADRQEATAMLNALSGQHHKVYSAVALLDQIEYNSLSREVGTLKQSPQVEANGQVASPWQSLLRINVTDVSMRHLSPAEIEAYWESGEPEDKAGAYAIQGKGAVFIEQIQGSYSGVMGLPLFETAELLRGHGLATPVS